MFLKITRIDYFEIESRIEFQLLRLSCYNNYLNNTEEHKNAQLKIHILIQNAVSDFSEINLINQIIFVLVFKDKY